MKHLLKRSHLWATILGLLSFSASAQLLVNNSLTPAQLAALISGPGVQISNPVVHCGVNGYGKYNAAGTSLNITEGLLLTTGTIYNAVGANDVGNKTTSFSASTPYTLLDSYTGRSTKEYCEFEFDIIPQGDTLKFDFVFASEEYEEWVGSAYNDVFGFFISGPGIVPDAGVAPYHNIALIPSTSIPVTINNVNQISHTAYYQNNNGSTTVQYDGYTKGLKAISQVTPCASYHLKLVVADVSDKLWDSGVFIEKISSNNILLLSHTAGGIPNMVEGCNNGTFSFTRPVIKPTPLVINYWIAGTATNGTDYPLIGSSPLPTDMKTIIIPGGSATATLPINPVQDGINEGLEYLTVYLGNPFCSSVIMDSLRFYIQDSLFTTVSPIKDSICKGQSVNITTTGGGSAFNWLPATGLSATNIMNPIATPLTTTTYTLTTTASTCVKNKWSTIYVSDISLAFTSVNCSCLGSNNGSATAIPSGGFPPYTYSWTGPSGFTATSASISSLAPGTYTVTVTGKKSCSKTGTVTITQPTILSSSVTSPTYNGGYNIACNGSSTGAATVNASGGTSPYTFSWSPSGGTAATASGLSAGTYTVTITDSHGCTRTSTITLTQAPLLTSTLSAQTNVNCFSNATGSATITTSGGTPPYTFSWNTSPIQTTAIATSLSAGTYTCTIKDANNCSNLVSVTITQPSAALTANISSQTNVLCRGNATGSATITATGGTAGYTYLWSPSGGTAATASSLAAGSYNVTVTDSKGCTKTVAVTITQPASNLSASISSQTNVLCFGNNSGAATVSATGGTPGYTYLWSPSGGTAATASGLIAGTYSCVVKDQNNCSFTAVAVITQPIAALTVTVPTHTNVLCFGNATGVANSNVTGGTLPFTYLWSPTGGTAASASGLTAGTYTVTVRDGNNCTGTASVVITQPVSAISASLSSQTNVLCFGTSIGAATVSATGGTGSYTYTWTPSGGTAATASSLTAGTYTCTVKDANNCTTTVTATITQPATLLGSSITASTNVLCRGNATGAATVTAIGGSGLYTYLWAPSGGTAASANSLTAGTYTVTVSDANGCNIPSTATVTITQPAAILSATATSPLFNGNNISCNGGSNGSINLSPAGGTSPYTFSWTGPGSYTASTEDISGLSAGTYSVTVTDAHGCTTTLTKPITQPAVLGLTSVVTNATCPAFTNGAINITVSGGTSPYSFAWSGPSAFSAATEDILGLASGNYTVTITDANGCTKISTITVTQPSSIVVTNTTSSYTGGYQVSCYNGSNGSINITVSGGTPFPGPIYTYLWTGPGAFTSTSQNISGLVAGTYQVVVTDQAGCNASKTIVLTQPNAISAALTPSIVNGGYNITCNGSTTGTISLVVSGGTPAYTYSWNGPSSYSSSLQNISGLGAGTYTVTVTDVNSCTGTNTITLTQPAVLNASATSPTVAGGYNITCNGASNGAINLSVTGGTTAYSYAWSGPSGFTSTLQNPTGLIAGIYNVLVTDANGCTKPTSITLTQPPVLTNGLTSPTVAGGFNITCNGASNGSINNTVAGGVSPFTYVWTGTPTYTNTTEDISGLTVGTYSVVVTDANGCTSSSSTTLTQPTVLSSSINSATVSGGYNITCFGTSTGSITLTPSGGTTAYTYSWTGPGSYTSSNQNPSSLVAGTYSVTLTDANGCTTTNTITLTQPTVLTSSLSSPTVSGGYNITCNGLSNGSVNMTANGGTTSYAFAWTGPSGFTSTTEDISSLAAGTYSVTVTDANSCTSTNTITLTQPAVFSGSLSSATYNGGYNISCNGNLDGNILLTLGGGTPTYSYNWNNGVTTQNLSSVAAGTYVVIVNDANNCSFTQSITLTQPAALLASAASPTVVGGYNITCNGNTNGSINLGVAGGTSPYTYIWTGPGAFTATTQDVSSLGAGLYNVNVTDNNGCLATDSITLTQPAALSIALSSNTVNGGFNISCNGNNNGNVNAVVTGGTPIYLYNWNGPAGFTSTASTLTSLIAGTYNLSVTDTNGCIASNAILLTQPAVLSSTPTVSNYVGGFNISCNGASDGSISLSTSGGATPYDYSWTGPGTFTANTANISGLTVGTYTLILGDANGCSFSLTQTLTEPASITDNMSISSFNGGNNISCNGAADGSINLTLAGGTTPYTQTWNGPSGYTSTLANISGLQAGTYFVSIVDANGCSISDTAILLQPTILTNTLSSQLYVGGFNIKCHGDSSGVIYNVVSGGTPQYSYSWTGPGTFTSTTMELYYVPAGTYNLTIADTNGCTASSAITLSEAPTPMTGTLSPSLFVGGFNIACFGGSNGSIDLTYSGGIPGYTIWWRGPGSYIDSTEDISGLFAGNYNVVVTDTNGCQLSIDISLTEPSQAIHDSLILSQFTGGNNIDCAGSNTGSINLFPMGGTPGYSYNWSGPSGFVSTNQDINSLISGSYILTLTDTNSCVIMDTVTLTEPAPMSASALISSFNGNSVSCFGSSNGQIDFTINGGSAAYSYSWTGPSGFTSGTEDISALLAGIYSVTIVDANFCSLDTTFILTQPTVMNSSTTTTPATCAAMNGTADLTISGGVIPYNTIWSNSAITEDLSGVIGGVYTVVITDANGCVLNDTVTINQISLMSANSSVNDVLCYGNTDGSISITVVNGTQPFIYSWSTGATTSSISNLSAGTYSVVITDGSGCTVVDTFNVVQAPEIVLSINSSQYTGGFNISSYQGSNGNIDLTVTGGFIPYVYNWSNLATTEDQMNLLAGNYTVIVTDSAGCSVIGNITLTEPLLLQMPTGFSPNGDGKNDLFVIHGIEIYPDNELVIFNRWGNVVNEFTGYNNNWDGRASNGETLPNGTYFAILSINGEEIVLKGYVDLRK
jgi:gliding motility-associated-like protein